MQNIQNSTASTSSSSGVSRTGCVAASSSSDSSGARAEAKSSKISDGGGGVIGSGGSSGDSCTLHDPAAAATKQQHQEQPLTIHYLASFHEICVVTALLPLVTLFTCFVTAYVFQYDDVHETHCRVYNIIPSISAITGVSPQRYFWRFSIALHIGPRIPIAFVYKNYYRSQLKRLSPELVPQASWLISLILVLNCIEIASLGGVTYISNRENYPVHERIFITFMVCSLCYMLATIKLNGILNAGQSLNVQQQQSIKWKKFFFVASILSTIGLLVFFAKHRFYCHDLAFSWFAFFEYLIAIANMLYHFTIIWDFPSQYMVILQGPLENISQYLSSRPKTD
ncbi:post-GPI attachment to proteins factor 2-like isoform X2 [Drosophila guanche]|uniref:Blast:Post-GPI attachment to proteins factor 2-like n=1 Tax=Drosophila guanche TaxID=7266 RepID=A0A3B0K311_DROGU|nr:post-GPI attachment to proteins factor 2-like isoform X2 [Drosophila guanche]SPP88647.1 blast:Post-GPI attachment to proteins factor 2-like [Drosophila guanche]